jgi:hypothetical protein
MEGMKLQNKSEGDLESEMKIVTAIRNIINKNFRLQKCTKICYPGHWRIQRGGLGGSNPTPHPEILKKPGHIPSSVEYNL